MQFYNELNLNDSSVTTPRGFTGWLIAPKSSELHPDLQKFSNLRYDATKLSEGNFVIYLKATDAFNNVHTLGSIYVATIPSNCGTIQMNNLNVNYVRKGIGSILVQTVIDFAIKAGYSMLIFNTAGILMNMNAGKNFFEKKFGAEVITTFKNIRSGNLNVFYRILLQKGPE